MLKKSKAQHKTELTTELNLLKERFMYIFEKKLLESKIFVRRYNLRLRHRFYVDVRASFKGLVRLVLGLTPSHT